MEIDKIVADLKKERDRLVRAITALVGVGAAPTGKRRGRKPGPKAAATKKKRRGGISAEGRKRLSEMMKEAMGRAQKERTHETREIAPSLGRYAS